MAPFAFFDEIYKSFDDREVLRGLTLLVRQGEAQFRLWHGETPPAGLFAAAAREGLQYSARP